MDTYSMTVGRPCPAVITGKPLAAGGSLGRTEATGRGCVFVIESAAKARKMDLGKVRVAVQGFGNAGYFVARFLHQLGAKIVAVNDTRGGIYNSHGMDPVAIKQHKTETGSVVGFHGADAVGNEELLTCSCDILVPAALEEQITSKNADKIKASLIAEAANGPTTPEADAILEAKGAFLIPDILANSGGVTVSYFEWVQNLQHYYWDEEEVNARLKRILDKAFEEVYDLSVYKKVTLRTASLMTAVGRVAETIKTLGIYP
jgi:glutamate dehydrogenase/leucine dehydrogenase